MSWKLYSDAGLTTEYGGILSLVHYTDFSDNPQDTVLYYANVDDDPADNGGYKMVRADGSDIVLSIDDATPGSGHEATEIKLATSSGDLATAVAGDPLNLGAELISGASGVTEIHIRVTNAVATIGTSTELSISKNETVVRSV